MDRKWMHKGSENARVASVEIPDWLAKGFIMGRPFRAQSEHERKSRRVPHMTNRKLTLHGISLEEQRAAREAGKKWCGYHKKFEDANLFHQKTKECKEGKKLVQKAQYAKNGRDRRYNVSLDWRPQTMKEQGGHCAFCPATTGRAHKHGRRTSLFIDHDHKCCPRDGACCGRCVRGLLCDSCNVRLEYLENLLKKGTVIPEPDEWTQSALAYLQKYVLTYL